MSLERYRRTLDDLAAKDRRRDLTGRSGLDFTSNDYLGLAKHPRLAAAVKAALEDGMAVGSGGSRLLRGNHPAHAALEEDAARFFGAPRALYMANGYAANLALLTTLPGRHDLIVFDALVHASMKEGIHASHAKSVKVPHNDADAVEEACARYRDAGGKGQVFIAVESLYSMDGDRAPLADLKAAADRFEAFLIVDEAHATGVHGPKGAGFGADLLRGTGKENVIFLHTCGKALGAEGALITADDTVIDWLVNRARPFIYSTAPSPLMAVAAREALCLLVDEPERRHALADLVDHANARIKALFGETSGSQIVPVVLGTDAAAVAWARQLQSKLFDVRAIRPPTVPEGSARLRLAVTLNVNKDDINGLINALAELKSREAA